MKSSIIFKKFGWDDLCQITYWQNGVCVNKRKNSYRQNPSGTIALSLVAAFFHMYASHYIAVNIMLLNFIFLGKTSGEARSAQFILYLEA